MLYKSTLGNVDWLNENEKTLRKIFPDTWTHLNNISDVQIMYQLKLQSVHISNEHIADFLVFMEDCGVIERQGFTIRSVREPVIFAKGFMSKDQAEETSKPTETKKPEGRHVRVVNGGFNGVAMLVFLFWWISGVVIAKGFWSTVIGIVCFPWALYLAVERVLEVLKVIPL